MGDKAQGLNGSKKGIVTLSSSIEWKMAGEKGNSSIL